MTVQSIRVLLGKEIELCARVCKNYTVRDIHELAELLQTPESRSFFVPFIALSMIQINLSSEHFILSLSPRWKISTLNLVLLGNVETVPPSISCGVALFLTPPSLLGQNDGCYFAV